MSILEKILIKAGVSSPDELSQEEKVTYDNWRKILSKEELTLKDIQDFCKTQIDIIETRWKSYDTPNEKKSELIPYHTVYRTLLQVIESPKQERSNLESQLNNYINN